MERMFTRLFQRYGMDLTLDDGENCRHTPGILFSVNSRSWQNMQRRYVALGEIPRGQYICILPGHVVVNSGDTVSDSRKSYEVRRAEMVYAGSAPVYYWCLCVEKGGVDNW